MSSAKHSQRQPRQLRPPHWLLVTASLLAVLAVARAAALSPVSREVHESAVHSEIDPRRMQAALSHQEVQAQCKQSNIAAVTLDAERTTAALVQSVPHLVFLAHAHEELREYDAALQHFQRAFEAANRSVISDDEAFWLNFQYAELLTRRIVPGIAPGQDNEKVNALKLEAVEHYQRALTVNGSLHDVSESENSPFPPRMIRHCFHALNTIGVLLSDLGRYQESVPFFEQAIQVNTTAVQPLGNLALALMSLGRQEAGLHFNERALELSPDQPLLLHNMGLILQTLSRQHEAIVYWERAHELNPNEIETISAIAGYYYSDAGDMLTARDYLGRAQQIALDILARDPTSLTATIAYNVNRLRIANAQLPYVYQSVQEIVEARARYTAMLQDLLNEPNLTLPDPFKTANIGGLGYYAVYQGFNDVGIRSQMAQIYRRGSPALSFTAPHVLEGRYKVHHFPIAAAVLSYQYPVEMEDEAAVVQHTNRKIRVGFHSSFLRHHSVGLLAQGVILNLSRDAFEVIVIIYDASPRDELTERVLKSADRAVLLAESLAVAQQQVADLQLDVLVFTEIGMDLPTYFLAFSRLALRTAVFWGHAVTSGIDAVDYFISSSLFQHDEPSPDGDEAQGHQQQQSKYVECVYEMRHLTTYFLPPVAFPQSRKLVHDNFDKFRESLGLPSRSLLETMFLVPQTLYKLHPDFDALVEGILSKLPHTAFLAVLTGSKPWLADDIRARWRRTLSPQVYRRIYFIRQLNMTEFMDVCAMADVVLDPFPVGGGRSSFEIFAVGTPIVMLAPRTTILQLTAAMYKVMGFEDLITFFEAQYIALAVQLALEPELRSYFRRLILANNWKLYESQEVIREWSQFFVDILAAKPPAERRSTGGTMARSPAACPQFPSQGNRLRPHSNTASEPYFEIEVRIGGSTQGYGSVKNKFTLQLQSPDDDPFETIRNSPFNAHSDLLQQYFTAKMLWNAQVHHRQSLVTVFPINHLDATILLDPIEVHYGDDLDLMARAHLLKQFKRHNATVQKSGIRTMLGQLIHELQLQVPMYNSPQWIATRSFPLMNRLAVHSKPTSLLDQCLTLVITTCKRLALFLRMISSLERALGIVTSSDWDFWFCQILVIDDNSSPADRRVMQKRVSGERFQLYWKTPEERGHAKSLNIALGFVRSRYVMYLEDDWEFTGSSSCTIDALMILRAHQTSLYGPLALVLLNDQRSGWERSLTTQAPGSSHSNSTIRYSLHEYAVSDPTHTLSHWPGFSLNPGVWDLHAISQALGVSFSGSSGARDLFDEQTDIFEQLFSVRVWKSGLRVAFLAEEHAMHIGAPPGSNGSAYVLNGMPRRSDAPGTPVGP